METATEFAYNEEPYLTYEVAFSKDPIRGSDQGDIQVEPFPPHRIVMEIAKNKKWELNPAQAGKPGSEESGAEVDTDSMGKTPESRVLETV